MHGENIKHMRILSGIHEPRVPFQEWGKIAHGTHKIRKVYTASGFDPKRLSHDVAILFMQDPFDFTSKKVQPIELDDGSEEQSQFICALLEYLIPFE